MYRDAIWVYWTGGYDSTFVVLNFLIARKGFLSKDIIQPVYLQKCDARRNSDIEQKTMQEIRNTILQRYPESNKYLLPTIFVDCSKIQLDNDIKAGMWQLYITKRFRMPTSQYSYIAQAPRLLGHVIDSGAELGPKTCISQNIRPYITKQFMLDPMRTPWYIWIFNRVRFPVVMITKQQMWAIAKKKGFKDLLRKSWTCRVPRRVNGRVVPCGKCTLCKERIVPALVR